MKKWYFGVSKLKNPNITVICSNFPQQFSRIILISRKVHIAEVRSQKSEPLYLQALELYKRLLGDNHPLVATSLSNLAYLYQSQGRYPEAEPLYLEAINIATQVLGENHPHTQTIMENYKTMLWQLRQAELR